MKELAIGRASKCDPMEYAFWVRAVEIQLARDVAPAWGPYLPLGLLPVVAYGSVESLEPNTCHTIMVVDTIDDPGLAGYHSGLQAAGYAFGRSLPDSRVLSHEAIELLVDPYACLWQPNDAGTIWYAREACDPTEMDTYEIEVELLGVHRSVTVSNFVYPRYFGMINHGGNDKYDHLGLCSQPFENRGYLITKDANKTITNVYASYNPDIRDAGNAKLADPHSRTARRFK